MATLSAIRVQLRTLINETDANNSHFADSELDSYINQAQTYVATMIEYPRQFWTQQVTDGDNEYTLPTDLISILTAYFGNTSVEGDIRPLRIVTEETLRAINPGWLEDASLNKGRPTLLMLKDKNTIVLNPAPDAQNATTGKKIHMNYVYRPADLSSDGSSPTLPLPYHDLIQFYAAHLAYHRLQVKEMADKMLQDFMTKIKQLQSEVTKEARETLAWQWGFTDGLESNGYDGIIP